MKKDLLELLFPPKCPSCGKPTPGDPYGICPDCLAECEGTLFPRGIAIFSDPRPEYSLSLYKYRPGAPLKMMFAVKNNGSRYAAGFFSDKAADAIVTCREMPVCDVITYLPRRASASRLRGCDQGMIISAGISERTGIPLEKLIKRNASSGRREQKSLSREERRENVRGAFSLAGDVKGKRVLLFDDIVTTGASAAEGTRVLIEGGAAGVCVICLFSKL